MKVGDVFVLGDYLGSAKSSLQRACRDQIKRTEFECRLLCLFNAFGRERDVGLTLPSTLDVPF